MSISAMSAPVAALLTSAPSLNLFESIFGGLQQNLHIEGLDKIIVETGIAALNKMKDRNITGHRDQHGGRIVLADPAAEFDAIHARQL